MVIFRKYNRSSDEVKGSPVEVRECGIKAVFILQFHAAQNQSRRPANGSFSYNGNYQNNRNSVLPVPNPAALPWFRYRPGVHAVWTAEEDAILEESLVKFASDCKIVRYAKIARMLKNKTVRDVAVRCIIRMR